eukprot:m.226899 g.226899  ORF g.226899 m.226899 type:complete len:51 (+) comp40030_c0_seq70:567-719(+)
MIQIEVSGTCLSWYQVFKAAASLANLKSLRMSSVYLLDMSEYKSLQKPSL